MGFSDQKLKVLKARRAKILDAIDREGEVIELLIILEEIEREISDTVKNTVR